MKTKPVSVARICAVVSTFVLCAGAVAFGYLWQRSELARLDAADAANEADYRLTMAAMQPLREIVAQRRAEKSAEEERVAKIEERFRRAIAEKRPEIGMPAAAVSEALGVPSERIGSIWFWKDGTYVEFKNDAVASFKRSPRAP